MLSICCLVSIVSSFSRETKYQKRDLDSCPPSPWLLVPVNHSSATRRRVIVSFDAAGILSELMSRVLISETQGFYEWTTELKASHVVQHLGDAQSPERAAETAEFLVYMSRCIRMFSTAWCNDGMVMFRSILSSSYSQCQNDYHLAKKYIAVSGAMEFVRGGYLHFAGVAGSGYFPSFSSQSLGGLALLAGNPVILHRGGRCERGHFVFLVV